MVVVDIDKKSIRLWPHKTVNLEFSRYMAFIHLIDVLHHKSENFSNFPSASLNNSRTNQNFPFKIFAPSFEMLCFPHQKVWISIEHTIHSFIENFLDEKLFKLATNCWTERLEYQLPTHTHPFLFPIQLFILITSSITQHMYVISVGLVVNCVAAKARSAILKCSLDGAEMVTNLCTRH